MKRKSFLMPLFAMALILAASVVGYTTIDAKQTKIENVAELPNSIKLEHKEAYKLDDAEFKTAVATKSDFSRSRAGGVVIGLFALLMIVSKWLVGNRKRTVAIGLSVLALVASVMTGESQIALAAFPVVPMFRDLGTGEPSGDIKAMMEVISKQNGEAITGSVKKAVEEATKGFMKKEELAEKLNEIGLKSDEIKKMSEAVEKQGLVLREIQMRGENEKKKDILETITEKSEAVKALAGLANGDSTKNVRLRINADKTVVERASATVSSLGVRLPGMGQLATRALVMESVIPQVKLSAQDVADSNGVIRYMDVTAETRNAAEVAEKGTKPESAIAWQEYTASLQTIADTIPVTKQAYRNLSFVAGEIERLLKRNHALRKDQQLYSGDGNAPNIKGLYTYASAATLASLPGYGATEGANIYDLISSLKTYVSNKSDGTGAQSKYMPNFCLMNPVDTYKQKVLKATDGHYLLPPFVSADGMTVDGVRVIETPVVTAGTLLLGDANFATTYIEEDVVIEMGWINDQFVKNQWTVRAEQVLCNLVRNADVGGFVKITDIDAAIAALLKP